MTLENPNPNTSTHTTKQTRRNIIENDLTSHTTKKLNFSCIKR
jgi:hypothetical protein